jgi:DNA-binding transcriptional ArsR family regulator
MRDGTDVAAMAEVAALVADPARSRILMALMGGLALTATELATEAEVAPSTASAHLAKLLEGGLLALERQGRYRYYRIASAEVASLIEGLAAFGVARGTTRRFGPADPALRSARVCYDHLAGERGVWLLDRLRQRGLLGGEGGVTVALEGAPFFERLGIDLEALRQSRRAFARPCLDWSERRHHLAGALGAALLNRFLELRWMERALAGRAVIVSAAGERALRGLLGEEAAIRLVHKRA